LAPFAAAVYRPDTAERDALARFVAELRAQGVRVGGLLQEASHDATRRKAGIDLVEITSGKRFPINRPTRENLANHTCSLDLSVLADSSAAPRHLGAGGASAAEISAKFSITSSIVFAAGGRRHGAKVYASAPP
jgi:hypothetical protein